MSLLNKTTWLLMPMAFYGEGIKANDILTTEGFIGSYIGDLYRPELDDKILIIYDNTEEVYEIPEGFENDYWRIITSQYHEVSDKYWKVASDFWNGSFKPPKPEDEFDIFEEIYNMGVS